ncbi:unnamed protein product [Parajaminaea phylloscopi]
MTILTPQMLRATRVALSQAAASRALAATTSTAAASASSHRIPRSLASKYPASTSSASSAFSTSAQSWSEATEKAKAKEEQAAGEAMGTSDHKPADKGPGAQSSEVEKQLAEKDKLIKELKDQLLYSKADLQNTQRRAQEEKAQASEYAITKLARDLTASLDILHLALRSVPEPFRTNTDASQQSGTPEAEARKAVAELYSGVELTSKSMTDMLKSHGVTAYDPTGEKFNPNEHEAMYQAPVPGKEPGTVLECSKVGFKIKGRVLRAAQVGVVQG